MLRDQFRAAGDAGTAGGTWTGTSSGLTGSSQAAGTTTTTGTGMGQRSAASMGTGVGTGAAGMVGTAQSAGNMSGDRSDVIDALQDLVECCKDGEYGFRASAEQASSSELKSVFMQRADECRRGADELNQQIRSLGGKTEDSGSAMGAMHRGWISVKTTLSTYDDKAVLEECERGEDNAVARYRKALKQPLPDQIRQIVERQFQAVQRNHDQVKRLRDQYRQ
ncbi:MAG: ferritin-like domain-containing protein [Ramlibacter sp.]